MLKQLVEQLLLSSGIATLAQKRHLGSTLVLAYHNVVSSRGSLGDASLHLAFEQFVEQLNILERTTEIVSLDNASTTNRRDRVRVAISFDDAYRGALELAIPELVRRGIPSTIFVAPGLLGAKGTWWDRYISPSDDASETRREEALTAHRGEATRIDAWMHAQQREAIALPHQYGIADESLLASVANMPGVTLGVHTWDHPNLAALDRLEVQSQLQQTIDWLSRYASSRPWIAYPYGLESLEVRRQCRELGLTHGYRVTGGFSHPADDYLGLPRFNVPAGLSANGFRLRLAGLLTDR